MEDVLDREASIDLTSEQPRIAPSVGFTGTRSGMTLKQQRKVKELLLHLNPSRAHHGDCVGADQMFNTICLQLGIYTIAHPGVDVNGDSPYRAYCIVDEIHDEFDPPPYLQRNKRIIELCDVLLAAPGGFEEIMRSGTWSTIRKARRQQRTIFVIFPDGNVLNR